MNNRALIVDLAKLAVAAAWADGELSNDEINALKDLLFHIGDMSGDDWAVLTMYMEHPVSEDERKALIERVLSHVVTGGDKRFALDILERLFRCDGKLTEEEARFLDEMKREMAGQSLFSSLSRALKSAMSVRQQVVESSYLREHDAHDYVHNTVFYDLKRRQETSGHVIDRSEAELRRLCLEVGLLARVANADGEISPEERDAMQDVLAADWSLASKEAAILVDIVCERSTRGLDYFRLCQNLFDCSSYDERKEFLHTLFHIANAANKTSRDEIEEIRHIAASLKLNKKDFIDAKLTISSEDRGGL